MKEVPRYVFGYARHLKRGASLECCFKVFFLFFLISTNCEIIRTKYYCLVIVYKFFLTTTTCFVTVSKRRQSPSRLEWDNLPLGQMQKKSTLFCSIWL